MKPSEFRRIAQQDIAKYPSAQVKADKVVRIIHEQAAPIPFQLITGAGDTYQAKTILFATGLKEILPDVPNLRNFYGKSIFNCPYCDGFELRDKPLAVFSENQNAFHMVKTLYNWSRNLVLCTNNQDHLTVEQREMLALKQIPIYEQKIHSLIGDNGLLEKIVFEDGSSLQRTGGFLTADLVQASGLAEMLGCELNALQGIVTDAMGRTNVQGVYAAGDTSLQVPPQLIHAAAEGSRTAIGINMDFIQAEFG